MKEVSIVSLKISNQLSQRSQLSSISKSSLSGRNKVNGTSLEKNRKSSLKALICWSALLMVQLLFLYSKGKIYLNSFSSQKLLLRPLTQRRFLLPLNCFKATKNSAVFFLKTTKLPSCPHIAKSILKVQNKSL